MVAALAGSFPVQAVVPALLPGVLGIVVAGPVLAWHMSFNAMARWCDRRRGFHARRRMRPALVGNGVVNL